MTISLTNVSKRYRYEWIYKKISYTFEKGENYAILGPNGSGKSTLLKVLSGHLSPTKGQIDFKSNNQLLAPDQVYREISYAAPYIDLIEEFTLKESIQFHQKFKPFQKDISLEKIIDILNFSKSRNKFISQFSSGMKQRLKLVLAICSNSDFLLLDEPTTNLDQQGMDWYRSLIDEYTKEKLVIIASNVTIDYEFCNHQLNILDYK